MRNGAIFKNAPWRTSLIKVLEIGLPSQTKARLILVPGVFKGNSTTEFDSRLLALDKSEDVSLVSTGTRSNPEFNSWPVLRISALLSTSVALRRLFRVHDKRPVPIFPVFEI